MRPVPPLTERHETRGCDGQAAHAARNFDLQDDCYGLLAALGHPAAEDLARAARDARLGTIAGGTDEIMGKTPGR